MYVCDEDGVGIYFITLLLDPGIVLSLHYLSELSAKKYIALETLLSPGRCLITEGVMCYSIWGKGVAAPIGEEAGLQKPGQLPFQHFLLFVLIFTFLPF